MERGSIPRGSTKINRNQALVVELADTPDLGSGAEKHESSSLSWGTKYK